MEVEVEVEVGRVVERVVEGVGVEWDCVCVIGMVLLY